MFLHPDPVSQRVYLGDKIPKPLFLMTAAGDSHPLVGSPREEVQKQFIWPLLTFMGSSQSKSASPPGWRPALCGILIVTQTLVHILQNGTTPPRTVWGCSGQVGEFPVWPKWSILMAPYTGNQQTFSVKGKIVNASGSVGHTVSIAALQLCPWDAKAVIDST